ncbi:MAG: hypothetical protein HYU36_23395 [Planctomycetes bacterium]|nr:hypothetical protein [Planctomycetota bacterium]
MSRAQISYDMVTTGWLSGWAAIPLFAALGLFVCFQLVRELRRRRRLDFLGRCLLLLRLAIIGLCLWLLCQPLLVASSTWNVRPELLVLVPDRSSLDAREDFNSPAQKSDVLEVLESRPIENRNRAASSVARTLAHLERDLAGSAERLRQEAGPIESGLPPGIHLPSVLDGLARHAGLARKELARQQPLFPESLPNETLEKEKAERVRGLQLLSSALDTLAQETALARQEVASHPDLLEKLIGRVQETQSESGRLAAACQALQAAFDEALVPLRVREDGARRRLTRRDLAGLAIDRIRTDGAGRFGLAREDAVGLENALRRAVARQIISPLAAVLVLSDGTAGLTPSARQLAATLAEAGVAVHSVLIGNDGADPEDAGLMAAELAGIAIAGRKIAARALLKVHLKENRPARLVARVDGRNLADMPTGRGIHVVELQFQLDKPGRHAITLEVESGEADAFPGNERFAAVVDVFPSRPRVLILSDRLSRDFVLFREVAQSLPYLQAEGLLADPALKTLETGDKPGQFPAGDDAWKNVSLLVLLGGVPRDIPGPVLAGLKAAVGRGLPVLLQPGGRTPSWSDVLEVPGKDLPGPRLLSPRPDLWSPLHALGRDEADSLERWHRLPASASVRVPAESGIPLLDGGIEAPIQVIRRGQSTLLFCGIDSLCDLRQGGNTEAVNRIVASLLEFGVRPWSEPASGITVFPPQPILGRHLLLAGTAEPPAALEGLQPAEASGVPPALRLLVTGENEVSFQIGGQTFRRPVHRLLGPSDFQLTPRAQPLEELARAGKGRTGDLMDVPDLVAAVEAAPVSLSHSETWRLWAGSWPLPLLLLLVSTEYLLRRRAGRVM